MEHGRSNFGAGISLASHWRIGVSWSRSQSKKTAGPCPKAEGLSVERPGQQQQLRIALRAYISPILDDAPSQSSTSRTSLHFHSASSSGRKLLGMQVGPKRRHFTSLRVAGQLDHLPVSTPYSVLSRNNVYQGLEARSIRKRGGTKLTKGDCELSPVVAHITTAVFCLRAWGSRETRRGLLSVKR